jgi:prepilin-type N-terminal cleavage/methylation domain-containing protein
MFATDRAPTRSRPGSDRGFTLIEMLFTVALFASVMAVLVMILRHAGSNSDRTMDATTANETARSTLDLMAREIRSAGYGTDLDYAVPQPAIAYVSQNEILLNENLLPFPDGGAGPLAPLAYDPAGTPRPHPLDGTSWAPPIRYRTGAELVRYTLDLNDDGFVDANDLAAPAGSDARATRNPNDMVLVRQVYGDSTGGIGGQNGGVQERVALVLPPGGSVPPIFTVYMKGSKTPWDWSHGPVPAAQLQNIDRVVIQVTCGSARPDANQHYTVTTLRTEVNSMRNTPNVGIPLYVVDGYVFDDKDGDGTLGGPDVGLAGARVQLGPTMIAYTNPAGYFQFRAPAGTYTLRHQPPMGYGVRTWPDSFVVALSSGAVTRSFADSARSGGLVTITVYEDKDGNGVRDVGDDGLPGIGVTLAGMTAFTGADGAVTLFSAPGPWAASISVPDSMAATTANPVTGSIADHSTASAEAGLRHSANGTVSGVVYTDTNKNGSQDAGEAGIGGVWVGVTNDGGLTVQGYATTASDGTYSINVPANDPPHTTPYRVYCVPPPNTFPTTPTAYGGIYIQASQVSGGHGFGMARYQVISLDANRVLSLCATDLMEKDWSGNATDHAHGDTDLILGADAGGMDNISVWFNRYNSSPVFASTGADRSWLAPQSVLSMVMDTLDTNVAPFARPDLVTGTHYTPSGNFFVWYTQNTSGNEGYFPSSYSAGRNYLTSDNGDVQVVKTIDVWGGPKPDIIVGTKSSTANQGQVEIWENDEASPPNFRRVDTYTTVGALSQPIGEVNGIALADLDGDGLKDLIVVTKSGNYAGQALFYRNLGKGASGHRFAFMTSIGFGGAAVTAVTTTDVNGDGITDVVLGAQNGVSTGYLVYLQNTGAWGFSSIKIVQAPGLVLALDAADMGGDPTIKDLIVGWRSSSTGYGGGVAVYYLDVRGLPDTGSDPSGGTVVNFVPAVATANFNYGTYPSGAPTPYLTDLAVGVKSSATAGAIVIFIR